jgi:hypothetical protein
VYIVMTWMPKLRAQLRYEPVGCDDTTAELVLLQVNTDKVQHSKLKQSCVALIVCQTCDVSFCREYCAAVGY